MYRRTMASEISPFTIKIYRSVCVWQTQYNEFNEEPDDITGYSKDELMRLYNEHIDDWPESKTWLFKGNDVYGEAMLDDLNKIYYYSPIYYPREDLPTGDIYGYIHTNFWSTGNTYGKIFTFYVCKLEEVIPVLSSDIKENPAEA